MAQFRLKNYSSRKVGKSLPTKTFSNGDIEIEVIPHEEFQSPFDMYDQEVAQDIADMADNYGIWGWCTIEVKATWNGMISESDYLGGCSYKDEEDFLKNSGYYEEMKSTAISDLKKELKSLKRSLDYAKLEDKEFSKKKTKKRFSYATDAKNALAGKGDQSSKVAKFIAFLAAKGAKPMAKMGADVKDIEQFATKFIDGKASKSEIKGFLGAVSGLVNSGKDKNFAKVSRDLDLKSFEFWSGAADHKFTDNELDQIEFMLDDLYPNGMTETEVNDLFWFEDEMLCEWVGIDFEDEYLERDSKKRRR